MSDPLEVVRAHVAAFNDRDVEGVLATFAEDGALVTGEHVVVGHRALRQAFADSFAAPIRAELALGHAAVDGETVACELTETLTVGDASHELEVAAFYTVRDGALVRVRIYRDLPDQQR